MSGLKLGRCDRELSPGEAPEWVHLLPEGRMVARDGREFDLSDPGALVLAFEAGGVDLPIDYEHQNDRPEARLRGPVPAAGWIKELQMRPDGLWARVEWTATAREMITNREYRFLSPSFNYHPKTKAIVRLKGAGLVHNPALHLTALAREETDMTDENRFHAELTEILGLAPETPPEDVLAMLTKIMKVLAKAAGQSEEGSATMAELASAVAAPDPARFVPVETVQAMLRERNATLAEVSETRAKSKVEDAMQRGFLSPAMKDWALALCVSDEASFDDFLSTSAPPYAHLFTPSGTSAVPPGQDAEPKLSPEAQAICAQLDLKPEVLSE